MTPAFSHFWIRRIMRGSPIRPARWRYRLRTVRETDACRAAIRRSLFRMTIKELDCALILAQKPS
jgi:hypothetical protein